MIGNKKWAGPVIYRTLARLGDKKGAARWEPDDAPNDVLRVGARVAYWHVRKRYRQGGKEAEVYQGGILPYIGEGEAYA